MIEHSRDIEVKAFPGAKKERVLEVEAGKFEVYVREPAQHNLANARIGECIAEYFNVPRSHVTMVAGHRSRKKRLQVRFPDISD